MQREKANALCDFLIFTYLKVDMYEDNYYI